MTSEFQSLLSATERPQRPEGATRHFFYTAALVIANATYAATAVTAFAGYFITLHSIQVPDEIKREMVKSDFPFTFPSAIQVSQVWIEYLALVIGCYVIARAFSYFAASLTPSK